MNIDGDIDEAALKKTQARVEVERGNYQRAIEHLEEAQYLQPQPHVAKYLEQVRRMVK